MIESLLVTLHIFANVVWIGSIVSAGLLAREQSSAKSAVWLYKRLATPAFGGSFMFGVIRFLLAPSAYISLHWFHAKLTFAFVVIALHHVVGARAKRAAAGSMQDGKSSAILVAALLVCAFASVTFAVFKTQLVP